MLPRERPWLETTHSLVPLLQRHAAAFPCFYATINTRGGNPSLERKRYLFLRLQSITSPETIQRKPGNAPASIYLPRTGAKVPSTQLVETYILSQNGYLRKSKPEEKAGSLRPSFSVRESCAEQDAPDFSDSPLAVLVLNRKRRRARRGSLPGIRRGAAVGRSVTESLRPSLTAREKPRWTAEAATPEGILPRPLE